MGSKFKQSRILDTVGDGHSGSENLVPGQAQKSKEDKEELYPEHLTSNPFACSSRGPMQAFPVAGTASAALEDEVSLPGNKLTGHLAILTGLSWPLTAPEPCAQNHEAEHMLTHSSRPRQRDRTRTRNREEVKKHHGMATAARRLQFPQRGAASAVRPGL